MYDRNIKLALEKCRHLIISNKSSDTTFESNNSKIERCTMVKDLGINISSSLKWKGHIDIVRRRAFQRCYLIFCGFSSKNIWIYIKAYKIYVRTILEYNSCVWNPTLIEDVKKLESVQKYF